MERLTEKKVGRLWRAALQMAHSALADEGVSSFADRGEVVALACSLISAGLVSGDRAPRKSPHAGADSQQDALLNKTYGDE